MLARAFDRTLISLKLAMKASGIKQSEVQEILEKQAKVVGGEELLKAGLVKTKKKDDGENQKNSEESN